MRPTGVSNLSHSSADILTARVRIGCGETATQGDGGSPYRTTGHLYSQGATRALYVEPTHPVIPLSAQRPAAERRTEIRPIRQKTATLV